MRALKFFLLSLSTVIVAACSSTGAPPPHEPTILEGADAPDHGLELSEAMPPMVFRHPSGITLEMVFLRAEPGEPNEALVRFTGTRYPTAGKVMLATDHGSFIKQTWKVRYDGRDKVLVSIQIIGGRGDSHLNVRLYMPQSDAPIYMSFHEEESRNFDLDSFVATHKRHVANGDLAAFAEVDRTKHLEKQVRWLKGSTAGILRECKQEMPFKVDWDSIPDDHLLSGSPCSVVADAITQACRRDERSRTRLLNAAKRLHCVHGDENSITLKKDGTLDIKVDYSERINTAQTYAKLGKIFDFGPAVLSDDAGRILTFDPDDIYGEHPVYLGDDKNLYEMRHDGQSLGVWDPFAYGEIASIHKSDGLWKVRCDSGTVQFNEISETRRSKILKSAKRHPPQWKRRSFALARDNRGTYYYVDRYADRFGGKNFRVFRGQRGQLEETKLVDIVDDSDGKIFATKKGKLRLVLGKNRTEEALWIEGTKRYKLVVLRTFENRKLIYSGLGIYDLEAIGTVCE